MPVTVFAVPATDEVEHLPTPCRSCGPMCALALATSAASRDGGPIITQIVGLSAMFVVLATISWDAWAARRPAEESLPGGTRRLLREPLPVPKQDLLIRAYRRTELPCPVADLSAMVRFVVDRCTD